MNRTHPMTLAVLMLVGSSGAFAACSVVTPPLDWPATLARWDGDCSGEQADGLGVLKEQQGNSVKRLFFGEAVNGELALGVIDVPEQGFIAGRFAQGRLQPSADRQTVISAFTAAAQAAGAAAVRFEQAGNTASANYYRHKEQVLRQQMD